MNTKHIWDWCVGCGPTVICGYCGVNTCGQTGECPSCPEAHQIYKEPTQEQLEAKCDMLMDLIISKERVSYTKEDVLDMAQHSRIESSVAKMFVDAKDRNKNQQDTLCAEFCSLDDVLAQ